MIGFVPQSLSDLLAQVPLRILASSVLPYAPVTGIEFDFRKVQPGNVFVTLEGLSVDGHTFIPSAILNGAIAVVTSRPLVDINVPFVQVEDTRLALAHLSAAFYGFPARQLSVIGVTGTDGKTTTSTLIFNILLTAGLGAGIISTVNAIIGSEVIDTGFHVTTPEAPDIQRYLARMVTAGLSHVVLEATSHGLAQHRVTGCEFDVGVVTNVTHEHLDYHHTYEAYLAAKSRLITSLEETAVKRHGNPRLAVLNRDDQSYPFLQALAGTHQVAYSLDQGADVWTDNVRQDASGLHFVAHGPGFNFSVECSLVGDYNVSNCLAAIAATVIGLGISPEVAARGLAAMRGVPGRMEQISLGQDFAAIVDFAHTPNALRVTLTTARKMTSGRVIAVFGSAGLRDRAKRRLMAKISAELADLTILTAEDPRTESLDEILAEMADVAQSQGGVEGQTFLRVPDRGEAIRTAIRLAHSDDLVIACGKGHEQSMCFGETEYPWDDRTAMRAALAAHLSLEGPSMPVLPTSSE